MPAIEDPYTQQDHQHGNLRDRFLKPGYEQKPSNENAKTDTDLDGKINVGDIDSVLRGKDSSTSSYHQPRTQFYSQSASTRTIQRSDGTMEIHRTVRDHSGNEETTVTYKQGDKEHTVVTRIDKDGHKEIVENFVNMDENERGPFLKRNPSVPSLPNEPKKPPGWFPFDKYFK